MSQKSGWSFSASHTLSLSTVGLKYTNFGGVPVLNSPWILTQMLLCTKVFCFLFFYF